jgi:hypothetical protein
MHPFIQELEKAKVDPSKFLEHIGGTASPGNHWMLVFTAGAKDVSVSSRACQSKDTVVCGVNPTENGDSYSLASLDARQGSGQSANWTSVP